MTETDTTAATAALFDLRALLLDEIDGAEDGNRGRDSWLSGLIEICDRGLSGQMREVRQLDWPRVASNLAVVASRLRCLAQPNDVETTANKAASRVLGALSTALFIGLAPTIPAVETEESDQ